MNAVSTESLKEWRAKLDAADAEIAVILKQVREATGESGPLLQRLTDLHRLKQDADEQVQYITETLIASGRARK